MNTAQNTPADNNIELLTRLHAAFYKGGFNISVSAINVTERSFRVLGFYNGAVKTSLTITQVGDSEVTITNHITNRETAVREPSWNRDRAIPKTYNAIQRALTGWANTLLSIAMPEGRESGIIILFENNDFYAYGPEHDTDEEGEEPLYEFNRVFTFQGKMPWDDLAGWINYIAEDVTSPEQPTSAEELSAILTAHHYRTRAPEYATPKLLAEVADRQQRFLAPVSGEMTRLAGYLFLHHHDGKGSDSLRPEVQHALESPIGLNAVYLAQEAVRLHQDYDNERLTALMVTWVLNVIMKGIAHVTSEGDLRPGPAPELDDLTGMKHRKLHVCENNMAASVTAR